MDFNVNFTMSFMTINIVMIDHEEDIIIIRIRIIKEEVRTNAIILVTYHRPLCRL